MTIKVDKKMRERIDAKKIDMRKENYIYESPDGGKTIYRAEINTETGATSHVYKPTAYDDVSGVQLELPLEKLKEEDKRAISLLSQRVLELEEMIDKIRDLVK